MEGVMSETGRIGKRGVMVVPAKLRQRYGLQEGSFIVTEARPDGILIRPVRTLIDDEPLLQAAQDDSLSASFKALQTCGKQLNLGTFDWNEWKIYRDEGRH